MQTRTYAPARDGYYAYDFIRDNNICVYIAIRMNSSRALIKIHNT